MAVLSAWGKERFTPGKKHEKQEKPMHTKQFFSRLLAFVTLLPLLSGQWAWAQADTPSTNSALSQSVQAPAVSPGVQAHPANEVGRMRLASADRVTGTYASTRLRLGLNESAQSPAEQSALERTWQAERKSWWKRNWPYVVLPLSVGAGLGGRAAAGMCRDRSWRGISSQALP